MCVGVGLLDTAAREMGIEISFRSFARIGIPVTVAALAGLLGWITLMG